MDCRELKRKEIAARMGNSPNTLNNQMTKIFLKVGHNSDKALVGQAILNGFDEQGRYRGRDLFEDA